MSYEDQRPEEMHPAPRHKIDHIATKRIEESQYELRNKDTVYDAENLETPFGQLVDSIKKHTIITPIQVKLRSSNPERYEVIDGGRRLRAAKYLNLEFMPCIILQIESETEIKQLALIANLQRLDLNDIEKGRGLIELYKTIGTIQEARINLQKLRDRRSVARNFSQIAHSISIPAQQQMDLIQIVIGTEPEVQKKMEEVKLATYKKKMVAHKKLKQHPTIQKELTTRIKYMPKPKANRVVKETLSDIDAGVYKKRRDGNYSINYSRRIKREQRAAMKSTVHLYLDIMGDAGRLIRDLTKHEAIGVTAAEIRESKHCQHIVKGLDDRELAALENRMELTRVGIDHMSKMVEIEIAYRENIEKYGGR